jgi:diguanylate cyclase (GGDEF)-like protein/PAS domain S-box-containing protein
MANLWHRQALKQKLSFCIISMTIFPLLLTMAITEIKNEKTLTRLVIEHNRDIAERTAENIDQMFSEKVKALRIVANTAEMKSMVPARQMTLLKTIAETDDDIQIAIVADSAGTQIARSDEQVVDGTIAYRDRYYYQKIKESGTTVVSDVLIGKSTGKPAIVIAEPIKNENQQLVGVLLAEVGLQTIINQITRIKIGQTGYAYLVNKDGRILLHPDREKVEKSEDVSSLAPVRAVMDKQSGVVEYEYNNQKKLAAFSYIPQTGWGLIVQQPIAEAMADVGAVQKAALIITLIAAFLASLIGIAVAGMMIKPITDISRAAGRLATGDMDARSLVRTGDEIGQLAATFNSMAEELCTRTSALLESEGQYRSLVENISLGIYRETGDAKSFIAYANPALARMLGYSSVEKLLAVPAISYFWNLEELAVINEVVEQTGSVKNREIQLRRKDGTALWCSITTVKHYNHQKGLFCIDSVVEDISERKLADEKLRQVRAELERKVVERTRELTALNEEMCLISAQDGLTGIANRRCFDEFLEREWQRAKRQQTSIAFIMLDVDFFKLYNDTYGHVAGDECLRRIAGTLQGIVKRATDLVARYGGEEFAVILPDTDQAGAVKVGERILMQVKALAIRHERSSASEFVTVSLGIAAAIPTVDLTPDKMVIAADQALYQVKQSGRNQLYLGGSDSIKSV